MRAEAKVAEWKAEAADRMKAGKADPGQDISQGRDEGNRTDAKIAEFAGTNRSYVQRARKLAQARLGKLELVTNLTVSRALELFGPDTGRNPNVATCNICPSATGVRSGGCKLDKLSNLPVSRALGATKPPPAANRTGAVKREAARHDDENNIVQIEPGSARHDDQKNIVEIEPGSARAADLGEHYGER